MLDYLKIVVKLFFIDSDALIDNVGDHNTSTDNCVGDRDASNFVNEW